MVLVVAVMAICFAACNNDDGKTGTPTNVSGKTYVYVSASESTGMMPKDELEDAFGGAFKFETDGTITGVNVEDGSQTFHMLSGGKWTQSGANVTIKTGEGTEAITYSGTATGETLSLSATNYGMTVKLNYKLYKAAGDEGEDPIVVTDKTEGTYKFYSYKIASVNRTYYVGDKLPGEDFTLTEDFYVVILKADKTGVMAVEGGSINVTWSKTGNELALSIEGTSYSGTLVNRTATVTDDEGNVWTFKKFSDSTTFTPATPDIKEDISGCAFSFDKLEVVKGTLSDTDKAETEKRLAESHFVFEKGGKFIAVLGGQSVEGTWTQNGNKVTATIEGDPQEFTIEGTALIATVSSDTQNYTLQMYYEYDADYKYDDSGSGGGSTVVTPEGLEGRAYTFYDLEIVENTSGTEITQSQLDETKKLFSNIHFVFEMGGALLSVYGTNVTEGTWEQNGDNVILTVNGQSAEYTVRGDKLYNEQQSQGLVMAMVFSYDPSYKAPAGNEGGGSVTPGYMDVSGCAFSYSEFEVVKQGTLTDEDLKNTEERLTKWHYVFNTDGTVIIVSHNNVEYGKWIQKGDSVILSDDNGHSMELTVSGRVIKEVEADAEEGYEVNIYFAYAPDYQYEQGGSGGGSTQETPEGLEGRAYTFYDLEVVKNTSGMEITPADLNEAKKSLGDTHFVFQKGGILLCVNGTSVVEGTWEQSGETINYSMEGGSGVFTVRGDNMYTETGDTSFMFGLTYAYDPAYKVPAGNEGGEVNPNPSPSLNFGGTYVFLDIGQTAGEADTAAYNAAREKYSSYVFEFKPNDSESGLCAITTANGVFVVDYTATDSSVHLNGMSYDGNPFEADMTIEGEQLVWIVIEQDANYRVTLIRK